MNTKLILAATATLLLSGTAATVSIAQQAEAEKGAGKGDRGMTVERALGGAERMFNLIDADNDGILSQAEIDAMPARGKRGDKANSAEAADGDQMAQADQGDRKGKRDGKGKGKGKGKKNGKLVKLFLGEQGFTAGMDWDAVQTQIAAAFNELDADGNGKLSRDEVRPAMEALKAARTTDA